jgi:hypothetical protein
MNHIKKDAIVSLVLMCVAILFLFVAIGLLVYIVSKRFMEGKYFEMVLYFVLYSIYIISYVKNMNNFPKDIKECYMIIISKPIVVYEDDNV